MKEKVRENVVEHDISIITVNDMVHVIVVFHMPTHPDASKHIFKGAGNGTTSQVSASSSRSGVKRWHRNV